MALVDATLVVLGDSLNGAITHFSLHSADPGATGLNEVGSRVAVTGVVGAAGAVTWSNTAFTGLPANQVVTHVGYWTAVTAGTYRGSGLLTGDASANAAGEYSVSSAVETPTSS